MSYLDRDEYGIYKKTSNGGPGPDVLGANTLIGNDVCNQSGEDLGDIKELMIDTHTGKVSYAVLSFGGFLGMGKKLFAVPWGVLRLDPVNQRFILDVDKDRLTSAPGFDKDHWPDMADQSWSSEIDAYYGSNGYSDSSPRL